MTDCPALLYSIILCDGWLCRRRKSPSLQPFNDERERETPAIVGPRSAAPYFLFFLSKIEPRRRSLKRMSDVELDGNSSMAFVHKRKLLIFFWRNIERHFVNRRLPLDSAAAVCSGGAPISIDWDTSFITQNGSSETTRQRNNLSVITWGKSVQFGLYIRQQCRRL